MREFNRLHSYTTGELFESTWISHDEKFTIQKEVKDGYGIFPNSNDFNKEFLQKYIQIPFDKRRHTTLRQCLETYYKIKNEL